MDDATIANYVKAGNVAGRARDYGASLVKEGAKLLDVANAVEAFIRKEGAEPAFPCCLSLNQDAAHFSPPPGDATVFKAGDVVKLDCGAQVDGYIGDTAITVEVGTTTHAQLLQAARASLEGVVGIVKDQLEIRDIGALVESTMKGYGYRPIINLTGHSVDRYHQHAGVSIPSIPVGRGRLEAPLAVAIEPFATDGPGKVRDAGGGHIYHLRNPRPPRDPVARQALDYIKKHHANLPFAERWVANGVPEAKVAYAMRVLERAGNVHHYPVLREAGNGMVAQFEHTFLVLPDRVVVTTRV